MIKIKSRHPARPKTRNETDLFYRYLYGPFQSTAVEKWPEIHIDGMTGGMSVPVEIDGEKLTLYVTPMWEDHINHIAAALDDDNGDVLGSWDVSFPLDDWTMDVESDVDRYISTVRLFIKTKLPTLVWDVIQKRKKA